MLPPYTPSGVASAVGYAGAYAAGYAGVGGVARIAGWGLQVAFTGWTVAGAFTFGAAAPAAVASRGMLRSALRRGAALMRGNPVGRFARGLSRGMDEADRAMGGPNAMLESAAGALVRGGGLRGAWRAVVGEWRRTRALWRQGGGPSGAWRAVRREWDSFWGFSPRRASSPAHRVDRFPSRDPRAALERELAQVRASAQRSRAQLEPLAAHDASASAVALASRAGAIGSSVAALALRPRALGDPGATPSHVVDFEPPAPAVAPAPPSAEVCPAPSRSFSGLER